MKVYTSYFAMAKKLPSELLPIAITAYKPKFHDGEWMPELAPSQKLLKEYKDGKVSEKEYEERFYKETLSRLDANVIYAKLKQLADKLGYDGVALLCYENKKSFCHRHLVAKWLMQELNIPVGEW